MYVTLIFTFGILVNDPIQIWVKGRIKLCQLIALWFPLAFLGGRYIKPITTTRIRSV